MKATWKNNSVEYVQWKNNNIDEIKAFVKDKKVFIAADNSNELYVHGVGILREYDYIYKNGYHAYSPFEICSWKVFPRIVNEDIGSGLSI